jgi:S1-C subfamily serine protease
LRASEHLPTFRELHRRGLLFPLIVLGAATALLLLGSLRPEPPPPLPQAPRVAPPPPRLPALRPNLEKTPLTYWSDYWLQLGDQARSNIIQIGEERIPAVIIAPGLALSCIRAADNVLRQERIRQAAAAAEPGSDETQPQMRPVEASAGFRLVSVDAERGVALFELDGSDSEAFPLADPDSLQPGSILAAISLAGNQELQITPGYLAAVRRSSGISNGHESLDLSMALPSTPVAAIVDLDGDLLGIAVESPEDVRVLSSRTVLRLMARLQENRTCHAIEVAEMGETVRSLTRARTGVVVEKVHEKAFVPEPSIRAGDILLEWDGREVPNVWRFHQLYEEQPPGKLVRYAALRGRRRVSGSTRMPARDCRPVGEALLVFPGMGFTLQWGPVPESGSTSAGWRVLAVDERSPALRGGLRPGDRVLSADGRDLTHENARSRLDAFERQDRPVLLSVGRGDRVKLLAVSPVPGSSN